jgi:ribonuclease HII
MVLAGIDEAGYGPLLGPLVVGCCAFEFDCVDGPDLPCLWKRLKKSVSKSRSKSGRKLHVNDSKLVYSPSIRLHELERSVLALTAAMHGWPASFNDFLKLTAEHAIADLAEHGWYEPDDAETFPLEQPAVAVRVLANGLKAEMDRTATRCVHFTARVIPERQYNRIVEATRNKSSLLFSTAALHLDYLLKNFGNRGLVIFCDRQGGRASYGPLLRLMFDEWSLEVTKETDGHSEYRLLRGPDIVRIMFREKAEAQCMPVALASMLSKYLRESLMRRFNSFWKAHIPDLVPTAGYYNDGLRFLNDIQSKRTELGVHDADLIRSR